MRDFTTIQLGEPISGVIIPERVQHFALTVAAGKYEVVFLGPDGGVVGLYGPQADPEELELSGDLVAMVDRPVGRSAEFTLPAGTHLVAVSGEVRGPYSFMVDQAEEEPAAAPAKSWLRAYAARVCRLGLFWAAIVPLGVVLVVALILAHFFNWVCDCVFYLTGWLKHQLVEG